MENSCPMLAPSCRQSLIPHRTTRSAHLTATWWYGVALGPSTQIRWCHHDRSVPIMACLRAHNPTHYRLTDGVLLASIQVKSCIQHNKFSGEFVKHRQSDSSTAKRTTFQSPQISSEARLLTNACYSIMMS